MNYNQRDIVDNSFEELLDFAKQNFIEGRYEKAEPILQQVLLKNNKEPEIFQMLATIYYDRGKFNKAIKTFRRALEIDPSYTDASVGLSIVLNDLGRYEEGQEVFEEAQKVLEKKRKTSDPFIDKLIAQKHEELGDIYFDSKRYKEATEEFLKAKQLSETKVDIHLKMVDALIKDERPFDAVKQLRQMIADHPECSMARQKLGQLYYDAGRVVDAIETWESILLHDPNNLLAKTSLKLASEAELTVSKV